MVELGAERRDRGARCAHFDEAIESGIGLDGEIDRSAHQIAHRARELFAREATHPGCRRKRKRLSSGADARGRCTHARLRGCRLIVAGLGEATDLALATGQEAEPDGEREAGVDHRRPP